MAENSSLACSRSFVYSTSTLDCSTIDLEAGQNQGRLVETFDRFDDLVLAHREFQAVVKCVASMLLDVPLCLRDWPKVIRRCLQRNLSANKIVVSALLVMVCAKAFQHTFSFLAR